MAKPRTIQLGWGPEIPIIYEDRSVLALDKPAGWMLVPSHWDRTARNLQLALDSAMRGGEFWAKSRNLRFLRFVHRLDAETTGVLLFSRSPGAVKIYSRLFESRQMEKRYLAVVQGTPQQEKWRVSARIGNVAGQPGRMRVDESGGKEAETEFELIEQQEGVALLNVFPRTGRTHQIRVHLEHCGLPILGDKIYGGKGRGTARFPLGLRATGLEYTDPFLQKPVRIRADTSEFCRAFGFSAQTAIR